MRVIVVEPYKEPYEKDIGNDLKTLQGIVGGLIQSLYPFEDEHIALICNDEGKLLGLPLNRALRDEEGQIYDIVSGTFLLCSAPPDRGNFAGLSDEQIKKYTKKFRNIELYFWR